MASATRPNIATLRVTATAPTPARVPAKVVKPRPETVHDPPRHRVLDRVRPAVQDAGTAGTDQLELLALRWQDVDLDVGVLRVRATVQRLGKGVGLVTGSPKTARSRRTLPLPQVLIDTLREHRASQELEREEASSWHDSGLVFTTSKGTMIEPRNLNRFLDEAIERAGLRRIRFHDLRHTCASLLLAQGVSPRVVMEVLGHSQMSMTTDLYGHVMPSSLRSAADALDGVFG